jgi:adenylate cyclase class IV
MSYVDFTLKAVVDCKPSIEKKLQEIGANFIAEDFQHDFYFQVPILNCKYFWS